MNNIESNGKKFSLSMNGETFELEERIMESGRLLSDVLVSVISHIEFSRFEKNLNNKEYNEVYSSLVFEAINKLYAENNITYLHEGTEVLRARTIENIKEIYYKEKGIHFADGCLYGYDWYNSKEPAIGISSEGRANCQYSSYFYCANDEATAASEIKSNIGEYISLASFSVKRKLKLIKLEPKEWFEGKSKIDYYQDFIANHFSIPVSDVSEYRLTQFISDELRKHGIDGLCYKSHFTDKMNYVIFNCSMDTVEFLNSKIIRLHSQVLNFIDFSNSKMLTTASIPNLDENQIEQEKEHIFSVMETAKFEKYDE